MNDILECVTNLQNNSEIFHSEDTLV